MKKLILFIFLLALPSFVFAAEFRDSVNTSANDAWYYNGAWSTAGISVVLGSYNSQSTQSGCRFDSVAIPQGSVIDSAFLEIQSRLTSSKNLVNVIFKGEDTASSATFSTSANFLARTKTTAKVSWSAIPAWTAGYWYRSPDIKTILQEIVSRSDWVILNPLTIFIEDSSSSTGASRIGLSYDYAGAGYSVKFIAFYTYTAPAGGTSDSIAVDTGSGWGQWIYPAYLKEGSNMTFTLAGDTLTIAGQAGGSTDSADVAGWNFTTKDIVSDSADAVRGDIGDSSDVIRGEVSDTSRVACGDTADALRADSSKWFKYVSNIDTISKSPLPTNCLVYKGNGVWIPAPYDTSFTFVFLTFTDTLATPQLIGLGQWKAIGGILFSATYENGPPTSMVVGIGGDFDVSGSGWTGNSLTFVPGTKLSQATLQVTNYPDDPNDVITFTATADAEPTKNTTVTFKNDTRWDTSSAGTLSDADINGLDSSDLDEDNTQSWGTFNSASGKYLVLAYPDRLGTLGATVFRFLNMTAGFTLQDKNPHVNSATYSENYNVYKSNLANMGSGSFTTTGTLLNMVRYKGADVASYDSAFITALSSTDIDADSIQTATESGWSVTMGATNYSYISVPSRWNLNTGYFRYLTGGAELQAGFTEVGSNISWQNPAGYAENYDIFKSAVQDLGDGSIGVGQSAIRQRFYYGTTTTGSSFSEANIEALPSNSIREDTDNTNTWGTLTPTAGQYIALAVPARCAALQHGTDYETDGNVGTAFLFDGLTAAFAAAEVVSVTNEYGYAENYEVYASTIADPGDGSGAFVTTTTGTTAYQYWGVSTDASAAGWDVSDFETMATQGGGSKSTSTDVTGAPQFTVTAGSNEYIWFCYPKRLGTVTFWVGGFEGGFEAAQTVSLTNINGWTEDYYCWRSSNHSLGVTAVTTT